MIAVPIHQRSNLLNQTNKASRMAQRSWRDCADYQGHAQARSKDRNGEFVHREYSFQRAPQPDVFT